MTTDHINPDKSGKENLEIPKLTLNLCQIQEDIKLSRQNVLQMRAMVDQMYNQPQKQSSSFPSLFLGMIFIIGLVIGGLMEFVLLKFL
ncbi:hypothetical protein [Moraxella marmotae]|uniref:hypothetical protein n=1 Tax=Moraxella marmotae TaxID=3344520 RepID=UPI0035F4B9DA